MNSTLQSTLRQCARASSRPLHTASPLTQQPHRHAFPRLNKPSLPRSYATNTRAKSRAPSRSKPADNPDRGPPSKEDTQTDFNALNVLGAAPQPTTSVDVCLDDGFLLDSGLRIGDGDGVLLVGQEAFVWRPWMAKEAHRGRGIVSGTDIRLADRKSNSVSRGTGGLLNAKGQLDVDVGAWGIFGALWPRPDLIIVGTGASIRPLSPATRECLQDMGLRIEVLDTRNAASQFNMLATERSTQEVAAAFLPVGFGR